MTGYFTRSRDSATNYPTLVLGPFMQAREARTITLPLAQSSSIRAVYVPTTGRRGEIRALYTSHAAARAAQTFFTQDSRYTLTGVTTPAGPPQWIDGYYRAPAASTDTTLNTTFYVTEGELSIEQDDEQRGMWVLVIPFQEAT